MCNVTPIGHNTEMTLFNWTDADDPSASGNPDPPLVAVGPDVVPAPRTPEAPRGRPEVEIRTSTRRRKTSEAKWMGDRIVVSLPAHLKGEAREKTIAWLVDRLVAKQPLRVAAGDDDLMARRTRVVRSIPDRRSAQRSPVGYQPDRPVGFLFISFWRDPNLTPTVFGARVGARQRAGP